MARVDRSQWTGLKYDDHIMRTIQRNHMLDEDSARHIASQWHSGSGSPLYVFCSTGKVDDMDALRGEIRSCMRQIDAAPNLYEPWDKQYLYALDAWLRAPIVVDPDGTVRRVKNVGWLVNALTRRHGPRYCTVWRFVKQVAIISDGPMDTITERECRLIVSFEDGTKYLTTYASYEVCRRFLRSRRVLNGVELVIAASDDYCMTTCNAWPRKLI